MGPSKPEPGRAWQEAPATASPERFLDKKVTSPKKVLKPSSEPSAMGRSCRRRLASHLALNLNPASRSPRVSVPSPSPSHCSQKPPCSGSFSVQRCSHPAALGPCRLATCSSLATLLLSVAPACLTLSGSHRAERTLWGKGVRSKGGPSPVPLASSDQNEVSRGLPEGDIMFTNCHIFRGTGRT